MRTSSPADPQDQLRQAYEAFAAGKLDLARRHLTQLRRTYPQAAPVLHLAALVEKQAGRIDEAARAFEGALRTAPRDPEILTNFANFLAATGEREAATARYVEALRARPGHFEALIGLAIAWQEGRQLEEAEKVALAATVARPASARAWSVLGLIEKDAGRREEAWDSLGRALAIEPAHLRALQGRAQIDLERGDERAALATLAVARRAAPEDPDLLLGEAIALHEAGDAEKALRSLEHAVVKRPEWVNGHRTLAQMRWQQGDRDGYASSFTAALRMRRRDPGMWSAYLATLANAGETTAALDILPQARKALGRSQALDLLEANLASETGDHARADAAFDRMGDAGHKGTMTALARHRLRQKRLEEAQGLAVRITQETPHDQLGWALLGTCWRLCGDERAEWLYEQDGLIGTAQLDRAVTDAAADVLRARHRSVCAPLDQSLRGGTQTNGDLFALRSPLIGALREALEAALREYVARLPGGDPTHPLLGRVGAPRFAGSWSVRLEGAGFHINHVHPQGWLSSACYVALPPPDPAQPKAGWLKLGEPPLDLHTGLAPLSWIEPVPGRLALFPAYMWHGTAPFSAGERLTVAFDVVPAGTAGA